MAGAPAYILELTKSLFEFHKDGYLCDTVIVVDDGQLRAHSAVLAAASSLFKSVLKVEARPVEYRVIIPGVQLSVAEVIVQYMYTGNFQVNELSVEASLLEALQEAVKCFGMNLQLVTEKRNSSEQHGKPSKGNREQIDASMGDANPDMNDEVEGVNSNGSVGAETLERIRETIGSRQSCRKRCASSKIDADDVNMKSLYGTRTGNDRRCPKEPCPCGEDMEDELGMEDGRVRNQIPDTRKGPFTCAICNKVFPQFDKLAKHMTLHPGDEPLNCNICGRNFALQTYLTRHMKMHLAARPYMCDQCGASFVEKGFLDNHMKAHWSDSELRSAASAEEQTYVCRKCGETFSKRWHMRRHMTDKHRSRPAVKDPQSRRCTCPICGKSLSVAYPLSVHMRIHTGEKPYMCGTCGKAFYQRSSLRTHQSMHTGLKTHTCAECGKSFRLHGILRQHMRIVHKRDFRHECQLCGRRFFAPTLLRDHMLLHTGERPYQCATCGRKFRLRKDMMKHERAHTEDLNSRCQVCGLETSNLKRHMLVHSGDKPHACMQCGKAFRRKEHLRIHCSRVHQVTLPKREKVQTLLIDSGLLTMQKDMDAITADDCGSSLVIGDSVVVQ